MSAGVFLSLAAIGVVMFGLYIASVALDKCKALEQFAEWGVKKMEGKKRTPKRQQPSKRPKVQR